MDNIALYCKSFDRDLNLVSNLRLEADEIFQGCGYGHFLKEIGI